MAKFSDLSGFLAAIMATIAILFTFIGNFWCGYAIRNVVVQVDTPLFSDVSVPTTFTYGIWGLQRYGYTLTDSGDALIISTWGYCQGYDDRFSMDSKWKSAMAFTILAAVIGFITGVGMCVFSMCTPNQAMWKFLTIGAFLAMTFQSLQFLFFASNACTELDGTTLQGDPFTAEKCTNAKGANLAITGAVVWFVSMIMSCGATASGNAAPDLE